MPRFELVVHTADQAVRVYGRDMRELVENAAAGMLALLYIEPLPQTGETLERQVEAESPELLVHHALRELLYLLEDEALAPVTVQVTEANEHSATLRISVVPREVVESLLGAPIKAVTRHGLQIAPEGDLLTVTIVFDV